MTGENVRIKEANLAPAASLLDVLGPDGLFSCLLRFPPIEILLVRLLSRIYCEHASATLRTAAWQANHLPVPALCRARGAGEGRGTGDARGYPLSGRRLVLGHG